MDKSFDDSRDHAAALALLEVCKDLVTRITQLEEAIEAFKAELKMMSTPYFIVCSTEDEIVLHDSYMKPKKGGNPG